MDLSGLYLQLLLNASLLVALSAFYALLGRVQRSSPAFAVTLKGLLFGGVAVLGMTFPFVYAPGIIYDARSVVLPLAGFFGGPIVAGIAAALAGTYRWFLGGAGVWAGLATIALTAASGCVVREVLRRRNRKVGLGHLALLAFLAQFLMLAAQLLLPRALAVEVLSRIGFPVLLVLAPATFLLGLLLLVEEERARMVRELQESEERFRLAFETSPDAICINRAADGRYVAVNDGFERITGYTRDEILGRTSTELHIWERPEDRERLVALLQTHGEVANLEAPFRMKDGRVLTGLMSARLFRLHGEWHILSTTRSIEELKQTERRLRDTLARLEAAQELAGVWFVAWDLGADTFEMSPEMAARLGFSAEKGPHPVRELLARIEPEDLGKVQAELERCTKEDRYCELLFRLRSPFGDSIWVRARGRTERDPEGNPVRRLVALIDVTEQMNAAQALREGERRERLRNRVAQVFLTCDEKKRPEGILSAVLATLRAERGLLGLLRPCDPSGDAWICTSLNRNGTDAANLQSSSVRLTSGEGNSLWEQLSPRLEPQLHAGGLEIPAVGFQAPYALSVPVTGQMGLTAFLVAGRRSEPFSRNELELLADLASWLSPVLDAEYQATCRERERRILEAELRQAQKLEAVGQLAGGVAHDFNNLLSVILGWGEIATQQLPEGSPVREPLGQILAAANRAAALTRQLLVFSRRQTSQPRRVELREVIEGSAKMLGRLIGEDISLRLHFDATQLPVTIDPGQLEQVLMNLVVNARDAMPDGGRLTISASRVERIPGRSDGERGAPGDAGWARLRVEDTGCGMDEEVKERIFEPFFTTKEPGKGTGLGLAVAYSIIQQAGGEIQVTSAPGRGTAFDIFLPLTAAEEAGEKPREAFHMEGRGELILLVEDDAALRLVAERMLVRSGYQVVAAGSGSEAIQLLEAEGLQPDLVITDIVMPGMSGPALVEFLRRDRPALRVLYISGYPERAFDLRGVQFPPDLLLRKPFTMEELQQRVARLLAAKDPRSRVGDGVSGTST
ncbi:MAG: hypothetical protein Kow00109_27820 [Acidobacteriota bacterium]